MCRPAALPQQCRLRGGTCHHLRLLGRRCRCGLDLIDRTLRLHVVGDILRQRRIGWRDDQRLTDTDSAVLHIVRLLDRLDIAAGLARDRMQRVAALNGIGTATARRRVLCRCRRSSPRRPAFPSPAVSGRPQRRSKAPGSLALQASLLRGHPESSTCRKSHRAAQPASTGPAQRKPPAAAAMAPRLRPARGPDAGAETKPAGAPMRLRRQPAAGCCAGHRRCG